MEDKYVRLLENVEEKDAAEAVNVLVAHLKGVGRMKLLPRILTKLKQRMGEKKSSRPYVEVASEKELPLIQSELQTLGLHSSDVIVNPDLVSGWRIRNNGTLIDRSGKSALVNIYKNVIT